MKNKEIYHSHNYRKPWTTKVVEILEIKNKYGVVLAETAFYPEGGGQPSDLGSIEEQGLIDVYRKDKTIYHIVKEKPEFNVNDEVLCQIDVERRLDLMQQHSGQHLLSAVFYNEIGGQTSSFHLGEEYSTIDISKTNIYPKAIERIENLANQYIYDNLTINHEQVSDEELKALPLRKQPAVEENIKLVEIEGLDYSPCGGTHLENTGQLGILKIVKTENYKGNTRVYFKCGNRALRDYQNISIIISELVEKLSASQEEILDRVEKELKRTKDLSKELNIWKTNSAYWEGKAIIGDKEGQVITKAFPDKNFEEIERLANEILKQGDYRVLFISELEKKIIFTRTGKDTIHCGKLFKENLSTYNGRGGGGKNRAQAAFQNSEDLNNFYNYLKEMLNIHED